MSLFLQKKAQLEFFFRGGEVTLALGDGIVISSLEF